jgi:hypothetical protein
MKAYQIILLFLLAFFTALMVRITLPYFSLRDDVDFLNTKQDIIENQIWKSAFFTHVFTSVFLLLAGFTQFRPPFKNVKLHRNVGKMYFIILLIFSGPAGFVMGMYANGGITSQVSFMLLALLWLFTTGKAYLEIRKRNFVEHGNFMIRSYALTLSALTLRLWKFLIVLAIHPHPMDVYRVVAWLGWVPNILIAEWLIRKGWGKRIMMGRAINN